MMKPIARKLVIGAALLALVTPAFASPIGTDPEPGVVHAILSILGLG